MAPTLDVPVLFSVILTCNRNSSSKLISMFAKVGEIAESTVGIIQLMFGITFSSLVPDVGKPCKQ